jgi:hypothetical protein
VAELIAPTEPTAGTAGSGTVGDIVHLSEDLTSDALSWNTAFDAASIGIDYLTWAENPLGGLISAGVGWLLEHLPLLSDVWDKLTGDAAKIEQVSATWQNIAAALNAAKEAYASASTEIEQWSGDAAESYRTCAQAYESALGATATEASAFGYVVTGVGALVATTKDLVYTIIADFVEFTVIPAILSALATSWFTFGSSIGVAIAYIEVQADIAGVQVTGRIALGTEEVVVVSERTATGVTKLLTMEDSLRALGKGLEEGKSWGQEALKALAHSGAESGKGAMAPRGEEGEE